MFKLRGKQPGANRAPKMECDVDSSTIGAGSYTQDRIYLSPQPMGVEVCFNQYLCDFVLAGRPEIDFMFGVYERKGPVMGPYYELVAGTSVTVTTQILSFTTVALGSTKTLPPGHYYIAFLFDDKGATLISSRCAHQLHTWIQGDWVYADVGSFALPQTVDTGSGGYTQQTANEVPFWCALGYSGDIIP